MNIFHLVLGRFKLPFAVLSMFTRSVRFASVFWRISLTVWQHAPITMYANPSIYTIKLLKFALWSWYIFHCSAQNWCSSSLQVRAYTFTSRPPTRDNTLASHSRHNHTCTLNSKSDASLSMIWAPIALFFCPNESPTRKKAEFYSIYQLSGTRMKSAPQPKEHHYASASFNR